MKDGWMKVNIKLYFQEKVALVNQHLDILLPAGNIKPQILHQAMRYSVFAGGKRLRPVLFLATLEALDYPEEDFLPFACALELIHTYSLIHDDLPAMDNDDYRRGMPTCHKKFGEAQAILAGDALLTFAFNLMLMRKDKRMFPDRILNAIDEVAYGAGLKGMIIGQVVDMESENKKISLEELKYIHCHKTGALFSASIRSAAILSGCDQTTLEKLLGYAENLGLAFQITDDILDVIGDEKKLGKPVGSDEKKQKATYPSLLGIEESRKLAKEAIDKALMFIDDLTPKADPLREIGKMVINRET
ncbi:MAG: polyprenyl synthetase family protein [Dehalobacterium sp.]